LLSAFLTNCSNELEILTEDVPQSVRTAFQQKYPVAQVTEWEAEKKDGRLYFEAEFTLNNQKKEAYFKPDGTFFQEEK